MSPAPQGKFTPLHGILIKKNDFGEGSSFFTAIDRNLGKVRLLSFGSAREKSSRRSSLIVTNLVSGVMVRKPEAGCESDYSLKEIATAKTYPSITRDLKKMSFCFLLFEVLDMALRRDEPFGLYDELLGALDRADKAARPEDAEGYFLRMVFLTLHGEGVLPESGESDENLRSFFGRDFTMGNGSGRFLNDCFLHGDASCMDGKRLSARVVGNLLEYLRLLMLYHYRREPSSLELILTTRPADRS